MGASLIIRYLRDLFDVNTAGAVPGDVLGTTDGVNWTPQAGSGGGGPPTGPAGGVLDGTYPNPGIAASVAGNGLAEAADVLSVNVDGSTLEIAADALQVKDGGITIPKLSFDPATQAELDAAIATTAPIGASYVTTAVEAGLTAEKVLGTDVIMAGTFAARPAASINGRIYFATDTNGGTLYRDTGVAWVQVASGVGESGPPSGAAGGVLSGTYPNPGFAIDMATQAELDAHINDPTDAHDGSAISNIPAGTISSTDVQGALNELDGQISTSLSDAVILAPASSARNVIQPTAGSVIDAIFKAHAAQSVDLTQWQNSAGSPLIAVGFTGELLLTPGTITNPVDGFKLVGLTPTFSSTSAGSKAWQGESIEATFTGTAAQASLAAIRARTLLTSTAPAGTDLLTDALYGFFAESWTDAASTADIRAATATWANASHFGTGNLDELIGSFISTKIGSAAGGSITYQESLILQVENLSSTLETDAYNLVITQPYMAAGAAYTSVYGIWIGNQSKSDLGNASAPLASCYAIYSEGGQVVLLAGDAGTRPLLVKGAAAQTANLSEARDSADTLLWAVKASGQMVLPSGVLVVVGTGSPESVTTAPVGSLFLRSNGGAATTLYVKESGAGNTGWAAVGGSTGAPSTATYITQTADAGLSAEQALSALATGLVKNTTGTGVLSIGAQGTDYYAPGGTDVAVTDGGTGASTASGARTNLGLVIGTDVPAQATFDDHSARHEDGGADEISLTGLSGAPADTVNKSLFDANTVLAADTDNTPAALTMGASTILARLAAGNIKAATPAELRTLLDVPTTGEAILDTLVDAKGDLIVGTAADTVDRMAVGSNGTQLRANSNATPGTAWANPIVPYSRWIPGSGKIEVWPRALIGSGGIALTSGTLYLFALPTPLLAGVTYTSITFVTGTAGLGTPTNQWFTLVNKADMKTLRSTTDDLTTAWGGNVAKTLNLSSTYTPTTDIDAYVGIMTKASTGPNMRGSAVPVPVIHALPPLLFGTSNTAQTVPLADGTTVTAMTQLDSIIYAYVA